ncbi:MAG: YlxM family DNA-binding protein, partial [Oscillospiraceae bacterium]|nr:YlxM family DNA-binding protein [Oscillospiraceae bacterium]
RKKRLDKSPRGAYNGNDVKESRFTKDSEVSAVKSDPLDMAYLFDFYADILTDKQRDYFDLYYHQDLSLSEISESEGITRQGVRDVITRAEGTLRHMEAQLGLVARFSRVRESLDAIARLSEELLVLCRRGLADNEVYLRADEIRRLAGAGPAE